MKMHEISSNGGVQQIQELGSQQANNPGCHGQLVHLLLFSIAAVMHFATDVSKAAFSSCVALVQRKGQSLYIFH
jgi:hypothetical protein